MANYNQSNHLIIFLSETSLSVILGNFYLLLFPLNICKHFLQFKQGNEDLVVGDKLQQTT